MRARRIVSLGAISAGALAGLALAVVPATAARTAASNSLSGHVTLPGSGRGLVETFTVTASVPRGEVGSLRIRATNESQLPADIRAMAATSPVKSTHRQATFTFYIAINNLGATSSSARMATEQVLNYQVYGVAEGIAYKEREIRLKRLSCEQLRNESNNIDAGVKNGSIYLTRLQRKGQQPSPSEEVFDFSASNQASKRKPPCSGVEGSDAGND